MTRHAISVDASMIKCGGHEASGFMALITSIVGRHMTGGFSYDRITVMTRNTAIHDALVIKLGSSKFRGAMAHLAIFSCSNVIRIGLGGLARRVGSIMTGLADCISGQVTVIKYRWRKGATGYVTNSAILSSRNVGSNRLVLLASRRNTIMTRLASNACDRSGRVVNKSRRESLISNIMAGITIDGCDNMIRRLSYGPSRIKIPIVTRFTIAGIPT